MAENTVDDATTDEIRQSEFTASEVINFVKTLNIRKANNSPDAAHTTTNVGVAQIAIRRYTSLPDYVREMNFIVEQAINQRSHIICFPEFTGLLPASLFPQFDELLEKVELDPAIGWPSASWIIQAFQTLSAQCFEIYFSTMSALAASYGIYIVAGSTVYPENGTYHHRSLFLGPNGQLIGYQDKLLETHLEHALQIEPAGRISIFETPLGNFSILIGSDVHHFETARISANLGAQMIMNPTSFRAPYTGVDAADGLNLRVQEQPLYGVQSTLIGETPLGFQLEGPSGIFAPQRFSLPNAKNGMFVRTIKHTQTQLVTGRLNMETLNGLLDPLTRDQSDAFIRKNIDMLY